MQKDAEVTMPYWREPGDGSLPDPETRCQFFELGRLICLFFYQSNSVATKFSAKDLIFRAAFIWPRIRLFTYSNLNRTKDMILEGAMILIATSCLTLLQPGISFQGS
jgi:hypothetical protein